MSDDFKALAETVEACLSQSGNVDIYKKYTDGVLDAVTLILYGDTDIKYRGRGDVLEIKTPHVSMVMKASPDGGATLSLCDMTVHDVKADIEIKVGDVVGVTLRRA